jgi:hypothetical protein
MCAQKALASIRSADIGGSLELVSRTPEARAYLEKVAAIALKKVTDSWTNPLSALKEHPAVKEFLRHGASSLNQFRGDKASSEII